MADALGWLLGLLGGRPEEMATPDQPDQLPPSLPPPDVLYRSTLGMPSRHLMRDMGIYATPRPPGEELDVLVPHTQPGTVDVRMLLKERDRENARFNFRPGYLWRM